MDPQEDPLDYVRRTQSMLEGVKRHDGKAIADSTTRLQELTDAMDAARRRIDRRERAKVALAAVTALAAIAAVCIAILH